MNTTLSSIHIMHPEKDNWRSLCGLSESFINSHEYIMAISLEESFLEDDFKDEEKCELCWRDEDGRALLMLATVY